MTTQLLLLRSDDATPAQPAGRTGLVPAAWRIDERTRTIGLQGVASARAALLAARRARLDTATATDANTVLEAA
jgi:hypothetical protein